MGIRRRLIPFLVFLLVGLNACTLKPKSETQTVTIQFPRELNRAKKTAQRKVASHHLLPVDLGDFDCIGVNIVALDLPVRTTPDSCAPTVALEKLSSVVKVVSRAQASVTLEVQQGFGRLIQLFGYATADGSCTGVDELMAGGGGASQKSKPYELGRTIANFTTDAEIIIPLAWNSSVADQRVAFCTDGFHSGSGCAYESKYDCSLWDQAVWGP